MPFSKLIHGFKNFHLKYFQEKTRLYQTLAQKGQSPEVLMIACSDSRNDPALITNCEPGDIFVVRNVAAIVPPYQPDSQYHGTSAAIEFAVKGLKVKDIIVMGHSLCGGVSELLNKDKASSEFEFINHWIEIGAPAKAAIKQSLAHQPIDVQQRALEQAVILTSLNNLMTFPWIKEGVSTGRIALHGWYFDLTKGKMLQLDFGTGVFADMNDSSLANVFSKRSLHHCECSLEKHIGAQH